MPNFEQNVEAQPVGNQQVASNTQLLSEGYPGFSQPQTNFQPSSDASTLGTSGSPNSQLASLPKETLLSTIVNLPQQDIATFFSGLPQAEQAQINTYLQQNPNAQGQDLFNQLSTLPAEDLAQGLSMIPTADVQQALSAAQPAGGLDTAGATASPESTATGYGAPMDASGYSMTATQPGSDASGYSMAATQPGMDASQPGLDASQPAYNSTGDTSQITSAQNPGVQTDASAGQLGSSQQMTDPAILKALAGLKPNELNALIDKLPEQDVATLFQALPAADQQAVQQALQSNPNATTKDAAAVIEKLPTQDVVQALAVGVPANDLQQLLSSTTGASASDNNNAPKPGGSEFPLLFGLGVPAAGAYIAHRKGYLNADTFQKLTGLYDEKAPAWMKFGRGASNGIVEASEIGSKVNAMEHAAAAGKLGGEADLALKATRLAQAGEDVAKLTGTAAEIAEGVKIARVASKL